MVGFKHLGFDISKMPGGIIHVGAHLGEERFEYRDRKVFWFEPNHLIYPKLLENISSFYPHQQAFESLVTDTDGQTHTLHLARNGEEAMASSSELEPTSEFDAAFPSVKRNVQEIQIVGITLDTFFQRHGWSDVENFKFLVVDTEGTELRVLKGATKILPHIEYVEVEVIDFPAYKGGSTVEEIDVFLKPFGFKRKGLCLQCAAEVGTGKCYNALYGR